MKFIELSAKEFIDYAKDHPQFTFYQTPNQVRLKEMTGWKGFYVGLKDQDNLIGASMIFAKKLPYVNKYLFYAPRGFLFDYNNLEALKYFTKELKTFIKNRHGFLLIIDPYVPYKERDKNGDLVVGGYDNSLSVNNLIKAGYKHTGFTKGFENLQNRWISIINLENKTYDDIIASFSSAKRNQAKHLTQRGIYTRLINGKEELKEYEKLEQEVGLRRGFLTRSNEYYEKMYDEFYPEYMVMAITKINFKDGINKTQESIDEILKARKEAEEKLKNNTGFVNMKKYNAKYNEDEKLINSYKEIINQLKEDMTKYGEEATLACHQYMATKNELLCLSSGNALELKRYHGPVSAYNWGIKYALDHKMKRFNMYGISGDFNKESQMYGFYELKKEFGGTVEELIGEFHLVISPFWTLAYKIAKKIMIKQL